MEGAARTEKERGKTEGGRGGGGGVTVKAVKENITKDRTPPSQKIKNKMKQNKR